MHQGVGRLLLESEIRGGAIDAHATRRAAFVIAGGHALTARHCCAAATRGDLFWLRLPAPGDEFGTVDLPVRVVDEDVALDVAVLGVDPERAARGDTRGESAIEVLGRVLPLPVGLPASIGEMVRTQGYPADARDGGLAFTGRVVDPAARLRRSRAYALQLQIDELAAGIPHAPGGHSGGPVPVTRADPVDVVVGLVRAYPADETRRYAVGGSLLASRIQDLAERFPAVREAFAQRCVKVLTSASTSAMPEERSLATLIRAGAQHTRFFGRKQELDQFHRWCAANAARGALLMTGPAGQGKTRLAWHLCEQLTATRDWIALALRGVGDDGGISTGLAMAALAQRPLLLAVDYASEYGPTHLRALVDQLCAYGPPRWRLLLIARHTGDWWDGDTITALLPGLRAAAVEVANDPLPLPELAATGDDRQKAYDFILGQLRTPVTAFAGEHRMTIRTDPPKPPLHRPESPAALIYGRMSMDSTGKELGLTRQITGTDGALKLCAARGWTVTEDHIYTDNDLSASTGVYRPGYADLIAAIERGEAGIVVTYQLSRLWRHRRERAEGMEILKTHRVKIVTVKGPELDLSTAYGRAMAGLLGEFDTMESDVKGERMRSSILQKAHAGKQAGGGLRPFGYAIHFKIVSASGEKIRRRIEDPKRDVTLHPTEAPIVRDCAARVLAGEAVASLVRDLNQRGVLTSEGHRWHRTSLRRMLCSARISGRREHIPTDSYEGVRPLIGEIVSTESDWPAIISVEDSDRIRALLTRPDRRLTTGGARKHLLSGILHCARCGQPMVGRSSRGVLRYVCNKNPDGGKGACGRMFITAAPTDDHIRDLVLTALDSPEMAARLRHREAPEPDLHARIRADEDELEALAADHGNGEISRAEWKRAVPFRPR